MEKIRFLTEEEMLLVSGGFDEDDEVEEVVVTGRPESVMVCYPNGSTQVSGQNYFPYTCQIYNPGGGSYQQINTDADYSSADRWGRSAANNYT